MSGDGKNTDLFRLDARRHAEISERIIGEEFRKSRPVDQPTVVIIAGQPGAGKTGLTAAALSEAGEDGAVLVDVDAYRTEHPDYLNLARRNDRTAASLVQHDAGAWADELRDAAIAQRRNLVIDGTLKSPDKAEDLCRRLKKAGCRIEVRVMAVDRQTSDAGVHGRYERSKAANGWGRWVPENVRVEAHDGMLIAVERLERSGLVDRIAVHRRQPQSLDPLLSHDSATPEKPGISAAAAIRTERERPRNLGGEGDPRRAMGRNN